ncbi:glycosyltransferase family 2 protein [Acidocella sp.]|uniref:glycosyltransferase family 2 protein n=1 Tax=Acidocella sp. TaxID=50710 RepID=UPI00262D8255|nr:glycosyltransferase family 2 protein [Acidocella sp.]
MRVACVMMQRNEVNALEPWIRYHAHLFGLGNLFIIDHGSDHPAVVATLARFEGEGARVMRLPAGSDYRTKGELVSQVLRTLGGWGVYDLLLPLDCDEFLVLRGPDDRFTAEKPALEACLALLRGQAVVPEVKENLINILGVPGRFWVLPYQKVLFTGGHVGAVDHGSHQDVSGQALVRLPTRLAYLHFHHKPYAAWAEAAREKLRPYVDVNDQAALTAFRGPGWHLVTNLQRSESAYTAMMKDGPGAVSVRGLAEIFSALGIDPLFCER